jgi:hypothetical protein
MHTLLQLIAAALDATGTAHSALQKRSSRWFSLCQAALQALGVGHGGNHVQRQQQHQIMGACVCVCVSCSTYSSSAVAVVDVVCPFSIGALLICGRVAADRGSACGCSTVMCLVMAQLS